MENYPIYVGGEFIETNKKLQVINPYTGESFAETFLGSDNELLRAITAALQREDEMAKLPAYVRSGILEEITNKIRENHQDFTETIAKECGKPVKYASGEVDRCIQTFKTAAEESKRLPKEYIDLDWSKSGSGKEGIIKYFPTGTIAGITPFNFPLNLVAHKIAPAIAAGCPIILKPAAKTPLSALKLAQIIDKTALPKGALSLLPMNNEDAQKMVKDERIKMLSFTGSVDVGWMLKSICGKKKIVLELGGNAGAVISPGADLETAAQRCAVGGFSYSGQSCIHTQRIYVHETIFEVFKQKYLEKVGLLKYGNPLNPDTDISVMIDAENAKRVNAWVNEAVEGGATVLAGGGMKGAYSEPTVLTGTRQEMKVCSNEVFGPVVILEKYSSFEDVIARVNDTEFGLQAGVFTDSQKEINYAFNNLKVGGVIINDTPTFRADHMPYGGIKNSGFGREGIKYAILEMMESRILVKEK